MTQLLPNPFFFFLLLPQILALNPVAISAVDLFDYYSVDDDQRGNKIGWKGVLLNVTNTRMIYTLILPFRKNSGVSAETAAQSIGNIKLFEATFEAMPQLFVQMIMLTLPGLLGDDPSQRDLTIPYVSVFFSLLTMSQVRPHPTSTLPTLCVALGPLPISHRIYLHGIFLSR